MCVTEVVYNHFVCGATLHGAPVAGRAGAHSMIFHGGGVRRGGGRRVRAWTAQERGGIPRNVGVLHMLVEGSSAW